ncbi:MAG: S1C family serine protease [Actinomycetota bacterium]|nr:S1C family serine protease [Actinomycetota bacterium]
MTVLEELQQATERALRNAGPAVVRIGRGPGRGAGFIFSNGVVVTNAHNLRGPQTTVTFADGRSVTGDVAAVDAEGDLVAITVEPAGAAPLNWAEASAAPGQAVFALALPTGGGARITAGAVSALGRAFRGPRGRLIDNGLEHTAPLGRGSSGGPVVDAEGRLVAISTHRLGDGFYLALPADADLRTRLDDLARGDAPSRLRLGIALVPSHAAHQLRSAVGLPARDGLLVRGVEEGSPAAIAGVTRGDLLVSAGDRPLVEVDDLSQALDAGSEATSLTIGVVRGVEELALTVSFSPPEA